MKLIHKLLIIHILMLVAVLGASCSEEDKLKDITTPEVNKKLIGIRIDIASDIPQCKNLVFALKGIYNNDDVENLTEEQLEHVLWELETTADAPQVPFSGKDGKIEFWECENPLTFAEEKKGDGSGDNIPFSLGKKPANISGTGNVLIRFDVQGKAGITAKYYESASDATSTSGVAPLFQDSAGSGNSLNINVPELKNIIVKVAPNNPSDSSEDSSNDYQLRGNGESSAIFSDNGVCERVSYEEYKLMIGCVKQFFATGIYDNGERRSITQHENMEWSVELTNADGNIINDPPIYLADFLVEPQNGDVSAIVYPDGLYPDKIDWSYKCRDADSSADSTGDVTDYWDWKGHGCNHDPEVDVWTNKYQYRTTFRYLDATPDYLLDSSLDITPDIGRVNPIERKGLVFGLREGLYGSVQYYFKAQAKMDGSDAYGYSENIDVVSKTIDKTAIFKPLRYKSPYDATNDTSADFIEELTIQLKAVGIYKNDTSMDITEQVSWSTLFTDFFTVNNGSRGAIYGKRPSDYSASGIIKADISGAGQSTIDLRVRQKKLRKLVLEVQDKEEVEDTGEVDGVMDIDLNKNYVELVLWALFDNFNEKNRKYQSVEFSGQDNISQNSLVGWNIEQSGSLQIVRADKHNNGGLFVNSGSDNQAYPITFEYNYEGFITPTGDNTHRQMVNVTDTDRKLKKIQIIPSSIRAAEGTTIMLTVWGIYDNKTMDALNSEHIVWSSTSKHLVFSPEATNDSTEDISDTTSIFVETKDVDDLSADVVYASLYGKCYLCDEENACQYQNCELSAADVTIDDIQLKSVEVNLNKVWLADISGDKAELTVLGSFFGFVNDNCSRTPTSGEARICSRFLNYISADSTEDEIDITCAESDGSDVSCDDYVNIVYDPESKMFDIIPKELESTVDQAAIDIMVNVDTEKLGLPVTIQSKSADFKEEVRLTIYSAPKVSVNQMESSGAVVEGEDEEAKIRVELSRPLNQEVFVSFEFKDITQDTLSRDKADYEDYDNSIGRSIVIPVGETFADITFDIINDDKDEDPEKLTLKIEKAELMNAGSLVDVTIDAGNNSHTLTINDNDVSWVSFDPTSDLERWVNEGGVADDKITFHVKLSAPSELDATVEYALNDGTATADSDYEDSSLPKGQIIIKAGETEASFDIRIVNDEIHEVDEIFTINISPDSALVGHFRLADATEGATIVDIKILDNDSLDIHFSDATYAAFDATNVTNTNYYELRPEISDIQSGQTVKYKIYNEPDWATFDTNTGILKSCPEKLAKAIGDRGILSKDEVGIYPPSSKKIVICVKDDTDDTGAEVDCLAPFSINVRTCESSKNGTIKNSSDFNVDGFRYLGGDPECSSDENHVTVKHEVNWDDGDFNGIIEVQEGGRLVVDNLLDASVEIRLLDGGVLEVASESLFNANSVLEVSGDATIEVNDGVTFTYNGPAVNIGDHTLDIRGGGVLIPSKGLVLDNSGSKLLLSGITVAKIDVSADGAIDVSSDSTIDALYVDGDDTLRLSGSGRLNATADVSGTIRALSKLNLSGEIGGSGSLDIADETLALADDYDLSIDIKALTNAGTTLEISGDHTLDWNGKNDSANKLAGNIVVADGGVFRLIGGEASIDADISLDTGSFEARCSAYVGGNITLTADSTIDVLDQVVLTHTGSTINISNATLALEGLGSIERGDGADLFIINEPSGHLRIDDNLRLLDPIRLSGGVLEINHNCDISQDFKLDSTSSTIQINDGITLNYAANLSIDVDSLLLTGPGTLNNDNAFVLSDDGILRLDGDGIVRAVESNSTSSKLIAEGAYTIQSLSIAENQTADIRLDALGDLTVDATFDLTADRTLAIAYDSSANKRIEFKNGLNFSGGVLDINQDVEVSGDINVKAASTLDVSSDETLTYIGDSFRINQTLYLNGGGDVTGDAYLDISNNGTLSIGSSSTIGSPVHLAGGKLQLTSTADVSGDLTLTSESTIDISSGKTLNYTGAALTVDSKLFLTGGWVINNADSIILAQEGVLQIDGSNYEIAGPVQLSGGELIVNKSATISGSVIQDLDSSIDVSSGQTLTYSGSGAINLSDVELTLTGGGFVSSGQAFANIDAGGILKFSGTGLNMQADVSLDGGKLYVVENGTIDGDIFQMTDSTIEVSGSILTYGGASMDIGENTLYLTGSGRIENANALMLDYADSVLWFKNSAVPSVSKVTLSGIGGSGADIKVDSDATIDSLSVSKDITIDINNSDTTLRVNNNTFTIGNLQTFNATGAGSLRFKNLEISNGGFLNPSDSGSFYTDSGFSVVSGGNLNSSSGYYYLQGSLLGNIDLRDSHVSLLGDLTVNTSALDSNSNTEISTDTYTLSWDSIAGVTLDGKVSVNSDGLFRVHGVNQSIAADVELNGGVLKIEVDSADMSGNLTHTADSTIDVTDGLSFSYSGNDIIVGDSILSLSGKLQNDNKLILNDSSGKLLLRGNDSSVDNVEISGGSGSIFRPIEVEVTSDIDSFSMAENTSIDISADKVLTINSGFKIPFGKTLRITGGGDLSIKGPMTLTGGKLEFFGSGKLYADLSGDSDSTVVISGDGEYYLKGEFVGDLDLSGSTVFLDGDLILSGGFSSDSDTRIVTGANALKWNGSGYLDGLIEVNSDGTLDVCGGTIEATVDLNGGSLIVECSAIMNDDLRHSASSDINVYSDATFDYDGNVMDIGELVLSLTGPGVIDNFNYFRLDQTAGALRCAGVGGKISRVSIVHDNSSDARINIEKIFTIVDLEHSDFDIIDISSGGKLILSGSLDLSSNQTLRLDSTSDSTGGELSLGGLILNGGILEIGSDLTVFSTDSSAPIFLTSDSTIDIRDGRTLTYDELAAIDVSNAVLSLTGGGVIDGTNRTFASIGSGGVLLFSGDNLNMLTDVSLDGGKLHIAEDCTIDGNITKISDSTIDVSSGITLTYKGSNINIASGVLKLTGDGAIDDADSGSNFGISGDGELDIAGELDISSDIVLNGGTLIVSATSDIYGDITQDGDASVNVHQDKTLTYKGSKWNIEDHTLSLIGEGNLVNNNNLVLNNSSGHLILSGADGSIDSLEVLVDITIDVLDNFTVASLDMNEDITVDIAGNVTGDAINDKVFTIDGDLFVPESKNLCVTGKGKLKITGNLHLKGTLCPDSESGWEVHGSIRFDKGGISDQGDPDSREYSAWGIMNGDVDLRGVTLTVEGGNLEISADDLKTNSSTEINIGAHNLAWDGKGGTLQGTIYVGDATTDGSFDVSNDSGEATIDADIHLKGLWRVAMDTALKKSLILLGDSSIDVVNGKTLDYTGSPVEIKDYRLSLIGGGLVDNSADTDEHSFVLNNESSSLVCAGADGTGDIRRVDATTDLTGDGITVSEDFIIGHLEHSNHIKIDIGSNAELTISNSLSLVSGDTLEFTSDSSGDVSFDGDLLLAGGFLDISQDLNIHGNIEVSTDTTTSIINIDYGKDVSYDGAALVVSGNSVLSLGGPIPFEIELSGGTLLVEVSADLNGQVTHMASSNINVGGVLNYKSDVSLDIGPYALSLTGSGTVSSDVAAIRLNDLDSILKLSGCDGTIDRVDIAANLIDDNRGKIKVEANFNIGNLKKLSSAIVDISPDTKLIASYLVLGAGETLRFISTDATTGSKSAIFAGALNLNGGKLDIDQDLIISASIDQSDDSTIDISADTTLTYTGSELRIGPHTLYLSGQGMIDNSAGALVLNDDSSDLRLTGGDGTVDNVAINSGGSNTYRSIMAEDSFSINSFDPGEDTSIDISEGKILKIADPFTIPDGVDLRITGEGTLDVNGNLITLNDGTFDVSDYDASNDQYFNILSGANSEVNISNGDYYLRGVLSGNVNLSGSSIRLYGDLTIDANGSNDFSGADISTDGYTLHWKDGSLADATVIVGDGGNGGRFILDGSGGTIEADVYLNGGTLDIDSNTTLSGDLHHISSSSIDVSRDATFTYSGSPLDIGQLLILTLKGDGAIDNGTDGNHAFQLDETSSVLQCDGDGGISMVKVTSDPKTGRLLDINGEFSIDQFEQSADLAVIDISGDAELTINNALTVATGDTLRFESSSTDFGVLRLANALLLSGGLLQVDQSLDVSGDFTQTADSTVDISADEFLGYRDANPLNIGNGFTLKLSGDSSLDIELNGGVLRIESSSDLYGDITHADDSSIDISADKVLSYRGASVDINNALHFVGTGKFDNTRDSELVMNDADGNDKLILHPSAYVGWIKAFEKEALDQTACIEAWGDATIDNLAMVQDGDSGKALDVSIDVSSGATLHVNNGFTVPSDMDLRLTGAGLFNATNDQVTMEGTLKISVENLRMDISMDETAVFKREDDIPKDSYHFLKGHLSGLLTLATTKSYLFLIGDLTFDGISHPFKSTNTYFSVSDHTLDWRGDVSYFDASVDISSDGVFRVSQGVTFKENPPASIPPLNLLGGRLEINVDATIDRTINHESSSDIRVGDGATLDLRSDLDIDDHTLTLSGPGTVDGTACVVLNNAASVLRLMGDGTADTVRIDQSLTDGKLDVDGLFTISNLVMNNLNNEIVSIDISLDATLDIDSNLDITNDNILKVTGSGVLNSEVSLNDGSIDIRDNPIFQKDIILAGDAVINISSGDSLIYKGNELEVSTHVLTVFGGGSLNNDKYLILDHKDGKLYLRNSAYIERVKITGDLNGAELIDIYVEDDATIGTFVMDQDSNINIGTDETLTIVNDFAIPSGKRLVISGGGRLLVDGQISFNGGSLLSTGTSSSLYTDDSGDTHIAGVLTSDSSLDIVGSSKKLILDGDLILESDSAITSVTEILTGTHTLTWDGESVLGNKIIVEEGGKLKISGSDSTVNTVEGVVIELNGGTLEFDQDLSMDASSGIIVSADSSIDVADGMVAVYEGDDITTGAYTLSLIGSGFFYNGKDGAGSHIVIDNSSGVLRLAGDNGIVNKVRVDASGDITADSDFVIMQLLLQSSFTVNAADDKTLIVGDEFRVASDSTADIVGQGTLLLHDVILEASLDFNENGSAKLELAPDATLKVESSSALAPGMDLEFGDGLYIESGQVLTIADAGGAYTVTFVGGAIIEDLDLTDRIVLTDDISLVFDPVVTSDIIDSVDKTGTSGIVSPDGEATPDDVVEFKAEVGDKTVRLSWSYQDATQVTICRFASESDCNDSTADCNGGIEVHSGSDTSYDDNNLSNSERYYYKAFGHNGSAPYSAGVKAAATPTFVPEGLAAYYRFEEAPSGNRVADDGTLDNEGYAFGDFSARPSGVNGDEKAYAFDGSSNYIEIDNPFELTENFEASADDFSISLWLKTDQSNGSGANWHEGNSLASGRVSRANDGNNDSDFGLSIGDGRVMFGTGGSDPKTIKTEPLNDGYWHNITAVRRESDGRLTLYLDGVEEATDDGLSGQLSLPSILGIGGRPLGGELYYKGNLDEVRFYSKALTATEVRELYARSRDVVAYYRLDGDVSDDSGFGNHGIANGVDSTSGINVDATSGVYSIGGAYEFSGDSAYLEIDHSGDFKPAEAISYSLWGYFPDVKSDGKLCDDEVLLSAYASSGGYEMYCDGDRVGTRIYSIDPVDSTIDVSCDISGISDLTTDNWHNIAVTYQADPSTGVANADGLLTVYFDGGVCGDASSANVGDISYDGSVPLIIGSDATAGGPGSKYFEGKIDEVRIYDRALSADEIDALYKTGLVDAPSVEKINDSTIDVSWNAVDGVSSYKLYRAKDDGAYSEISSDAASPYRDSGLDGNSTYHYKMVLCNSSGCSTKSAPVPITTGGAPTPGDGGDLSSDSLNENSFTLSWTAATDSLYQQSELQYKVVESTTDNIYDATSAEASGDTVQNWTYNITSKVIGDLHLNTDYYFNVLVKNPDGYKDAYTSKSVKISFESSSSIATNAARGLEFFNVSGDSYLVAANKGGDSEYHKWNGSSFATPQTLADSENGVNSRDLIYFNISGDSYLAAANEGERSRYYKWESGVFGASKDISDDIAAGGDDAIECEYFTIDGTSYLAVVIRDGNSRVYKWNGDGFDRIQYTTSNGVNEDARDFEYFSIDGDSYLAVANGDLNSRVYKWNGDGFDETQVFTSDGATDKARDMEYFSIDGDSYLAVANNGVASRVYKWNGSGFEYFPYDITDDTNGVDLEYFTLGGDGYLARANDNDGTKSAIYRWTDSGFVQSQVITDIDPTTYWKFFSIDGDVYLALGYKDNGNSNIYKLVITNP